MRIFNALLLIALAGRGRGGFISALIGSPRDGAVERPSQIPEDLNDSQLDFALKVS
jgi:hypothetical protein